jgi:hypothetical protein
MTDYYDVNYAVHFEVGDSEKPLVEPVAEVEHPEDLARREAIRERQQKEKEVARRISAANREHEQRLRELTAAGQAEVHTPNPLRR